MEDVLRLLDPLNLTFYVSHRLKDPSGNNLIVSEDFAFKLIFKCDLSRS